MVRIDYGHSNQQNYEFNFSKKIFNDYAIFASGRFFHSDGPDFIGRHPMYDIILDYPDSLGLKAEFQQPVNDGSLFLKFARNQFSANFFYQRFDEGNALGQSTENVIYQNDCKWAIDNFLFNVKIDWEVPIIDNLHSTVGFHRYAQDPESQFYKWAPGQTLKESYRQYITGEDNSSFFQIFNISRREKFELISGIDFEYTESIPPYAVEQLFNETSKFEGEIADSVRNQLTIFETRSGIFANLKFFLNEEFTLQFANRYDYSKNNDNFYSPRISASFQPNDRSLLKFSYARAFQAPSLFYQYEQWGSGNAVMQSSIDVQKDNPSWQLENQNVRSTQIGFHHNFTRSLGLEVSHYHSELENLIARNIFSDSTYNKFFSSEEDSVFSQGFRNENIGQQSIYGYNLRFFWDYSPNLKYFLYFSHVHGQNVNEGLVSEIPRLAEIKFYFGVEADNILDCIQFSLRAKWVLEQNNVNKDVFPSGKQDGWLRVDANVRIRDLLPGLVIYSDIDNLFDADYEHPGLYRQSFHLPTIPQPGLQVSLGCEFNF